MTYKALGGSMAVGKIRSSKMFQSIIDICVSGRGQIPDKLPTAYR